MYHLHALKQLSELGMAGWSQTSLYPVRIPFGACDACSNYKTVFWRHFLSPVPVVPSPKDHGWDINVNGRCVVSQHQILHYNYCFICVKGSWKLPGCICLNNDLSCTNLCKIANQFKPVKWGRACSSANRQDKDEALDGTLPGVVWIYMCQQP